MLVDWIQELFQLEILYDNECVDYLFISQVECTVLCTCVNTSHTQYFKQLSEALFATGDIIYIATCKSLHIAAIVAKLKSTCTALSLTFFDTDD